MIAQSILVLVGALHASSTHRIPFSGQTFDMVPGTSHPTSASELAWLDGGTVSAVVASGPEAEALLSAPHFQVAYGWIRTERNPADQPDLVLDVQDDLRLRLGTALALSQVGIGSDRYDLSVGASYLREKSRRRTPEFSGSRQTVDLSSTLRLESWRLGASILDAASIDADSGTLRDRRLEFRFGRETREELSWGAALEVPTDSGGEVGFRIGLSREFRQALDFEGAISTTYSRGDSAIDGRTSMLRRSLELRLGTRLRFRPWIGNEDPRWMRDLLDPVSGFWDDSFPLRGWQLGASASWDLVTGQARPALELSRSF